MSTHILALAALLAAAVPAAAESLVATRTVRPGEILRPADLRVDPALVSAGLSRPEEAEGLIARRLLVAGRPIQLGDVGPPPMVHRNGPVTLVYRSGGLTITVDGRALEDAALGEPVRALNAASRQTVTGTVSGVREITFGDLR
jgi:flagellar basal body P-ring formation protein FlgA